MWIRWTSNQWTKQRNLQQWKQNLVKPLQSSKMAKIIRQIGVSACLPKTLWARLNHARIGGWLKSYLWIMYWIRILERVVRLTLMAYPVSAKFMKNESAIKDVRRYLSVNFLNLQAKYYRLIECFRVISFRNFSFCLIGKLLNSLPVKPSQWKFPFLLNNFLHNGAKLFLWVLRFPLAELRMKMKIVQQWNLSFLFRLFINSFLLW